MATEQYYYEVELFYSKNDEDFFGMTGYTVYSLFYNFTITGLDLPATYNEAKGIALNALSHRMKIPDQIKFVLIEKKKT